MPSIATTAPRKFKSDNMALIFKSGIEGKYNEKLSISVIIAHFYIPFYL